MKTQRNPLEQQIIAEQAARWLCDLRESGNAHRADFLAWLEQSPRHVREFLFADTLWREAAAIRPGTYDLERLIAEATAASDSSNVVTLGESSSNQNRLRRRMARRSVWIMASAAGLAAMAVGLVLLPWRMPAYSTAVGEQRSIRLEDGSLLHLNTRTQLKVRYSPSGRDVWIADGEALFSVQKDPARPFVVHSGKTAIQALGTQFNVYRHDAETTVAVVSGAVRITANDGEQTVRLDAGQEAHIASSGKIFKPNGDVAAAVAWKERRLVFRGEPLARVAEEFNRYNQRQFRIEGEAAQRKLLSGTFDADDPESLVQFLRTLHDVSVAPGDRVVVIRSE